MGAAVTNERTYLDFDLTRDRSHTVCADGGWGRGYAQWRGRGQSSAHQHRSCCQLNWDLLATHHTPLHLHIIAESGGRALLWCKPLNKISKEGKLCRGKYRLFTPLQHHHIIVEWLVVKLCMRSKAVLYSSQHITYLVAKLCWWNNCLLTLLDPHFIVVCLVCEVYLRNKTLLYSIHTTQHLSGWQALHREQLFEHL